MNINILEGESGWHQTNQSGDGGGGNSGGSWTYTGYIGNSNKYYTILRIIYTIICFYNFPLNIVYLNIILKGVGGGDGDGGTIFHE